MERGEREGFSKCRTEKGGREDKGSGSVRVISRVIFTLFTVRVRVIFTVEQLWWEATVEEVELPTIARHGKDVEKAKNSVHLHLPPKSNQSSVSLT